MVATLTGVSTQLSSLLDTQWANLALIVNKTTTLQISGGEAV